MSNENNKVYIVKQVPYCILLSSTDMIQKESEAQILVLHSNKITFMPDKVTVHYRNGRKHHLGVLSLVLYVQNESGFYCFNPCTTSFLTSQKKRNKSLHFLRVPEIKWSAQIWQRFRYHLVCANQPTETLFFVSFFCKNIDKNKLVKHSCWLVILDYLCKAVRQAPSTCIFAGD